MVLLFLNEIKAQKTLIHYWHFNSTLPSDGSGGVPFGANPIYADYSVGKNAAVIYKPINEVVTDTGYIDNLVGDTLNQRPGYGGCCGLINNAVRTRNPSYEMEFLWYMPTTNYKNIVIKYETEKSSDKSGQTQQVFSYSLDSGLNFITDGLPLSYYAADIVWDLVKLDLSSISSVNDNSKFVLRINFTSPNTGSKGNSRFDNITVEGESVNGEYVKPAINSACSIFPNPAQEFVNLTTAYNGTKTIELFNSVGILINTYKFEGNQFSINTSLMSPGFYFLNLKESNTSNINMLRFIKL